MISIYITLYQDLDFLKDILKYLDKFVNEIIIVDGPYEYCIELLQKLDLYYNESNKPIVLQEIINENNNKVKYFYKHWKNEKEKRMFGYSQCTNDIILLVDGDEFIIIDEIKLNNFIKSDKYVAGFDIYNMNRIDVNIDNISKKNIIFKKKYITEHQHLSYTWLVGVDDLEKQITNYIYLKETIGVIYHQTLNRTKKNNIIKYIFYTRLHNLINNVDNNNIIGYNINILLEKLNIKELLNLFYHSSMELIGIPNNKILCKNNNVLINLDKYNFNHIDGYFNYNETILKNTNYFCYVDLNYKDNNIHIIFDNVKNVSVILYKIEYNKKYIQQEFINTNNNEIKFKYINDSDNILTYLFKINVNHTMNNDFICKINNIYINQKDKNILFNSIYFNEIIPLGEECYTCMSIDNKFNKKSNLRNISYPFDYVGHVFIEKINEKLKNMDLIDENNIIIKNFNPNYFYVDDKYGFNYWHDTSYGDNTKFTESDLNLFIEKYNRRYLRLFDTLKYSKCLCLSVCHFDKIFSNNYNKDNLIELYETLKKINNNTYLIAFNYTNIDFNYENLIHINLKYDKNEDFKISKQNFEKTLYLYVKNIIN